ncbi:primase C-terminal domain-containing protein, partial [Klebsiella pneumoniae]|nr:primase C-terminal domain-containing protein [Klebsiella pneumoniae]
LNAANDKEIVADYGLGRNCTLFDKTRKWAYRAIRQGWPEYDQWLQACYERASAYNLQFAAPLDDNEVSSIAKSIAKWTNVKFNQESFEDYVARTHSKKIQALRGSKSKGGGRPQIEKAKIDEIGKMLAQGFSMRNIAKKIKVSTSTV